MLPFCIPLLTFQAKNPGDDSPGSPSFLTGRAELQKLWGIHMIKILCSRERIRRSVDILPFIVVYFLILRNSSFPQIHRA